MNDLIERAFDRFQSSGYREASILDSAFYTDPDIFALEKDRILHRSWHLACRIEDVEKPGDYVCDDFLGQKFFVLHGYDGQVRAFANVCRHRWSTLLEGQGTLGNRKSAITCPYHRWCYNFEGKLIGAPDVKGLERFSTDMNGLHHVRLHIWNGFVFITLSEQTPPFEAYIGDYDKLVGPYHGSLRCVRQTRYEVEANWKGYIEVDLETYHTPSVHPGSIGIQDLEILKPNGNYIGVYHRCNDTVALRPDQRHLGFPHIDGLQGRHKQGTHFCVLLPSIIIVNTLDSMWWLQKVPAEVDRTIVRCGFAFPESTIARDDFEETASLYYDRWDTVIVEDNWIVEKQYQGIKSSQFATLGRYANSEPMVFDFDYWVLSQLSQRQLLQSAV